LPLHADHPDEAQALRDLVIDPAPEVFVDDVPEERVGDLPARLLVELRGDVGDSIALIDQVCSSAIPENRSE